MATAAITNPIRPSLDRQGVVILDGGLATELEARGCDLGDELWSARLLLEDPDLIRHVHLDYLEAGADCIIAASYQATVQGFMARGLEEKAAEALLGKPVELACEARDQFLAARWAGSRPAAAGRRQHRTLWCFSRRRLGVHREL